MTLMRQDELGGCDFIDVLEEAALMKKRVAVKMRDGESFIDEVRDVVTTDGEDWVDFLNHDRVKVKEILGMSRAEPTRH